MTKAVRTTVVSVTYNSANVLAKMLASVPAGVPVIVVDNASTDGSVAVAANAAARTIRLDSNQGFGRACNRGAAEAATEFVLFLNPDAVLDVDCIGALEAAADRHLAASAFNPGIRSRDGGEYFKRRSVLIARSQHLARGWPPEDREVPVLSGAALFCRKSAFDAVGGFDPAIFLYHEDDDLSIRLKSECGPLMFIRDAAVMHSEGRSSARTADIAALKAYHMGRSRVYAMRKHGLTLYRVRNVAAGLGKLANPLVLLSSRKRAQASGFLKGVFSAF